MSIFQHSFNSDSFYFKCYLLKLNFLDYLKTVLSSKIFTVLENGNLVQNNYKRRVNEGKEAQLYPYESFVNFKFNFWIKVVNFCIIWDWSKMKPQELVTPKGHTKAQLQWWKLTFPPVCWLTITDNFLNDCRYCNCPTLKKQMYC